MNHKSTDYNYSFTTNLPIEEVYQKLLDIRFWWSGLFNETITGQANAVSDEFTFLAGEGMHYSKQKLIELVPFECITWLVTESNLSFLHQSDEWTNTRISFYLSKQQQQVEVVFTHVGLNKAIECFDTCSDAWSRYMQALAGKLNAS